MDDQSCMSYAFDATSGASLWSALGCGDTLVTESALLSFSGFPPAALDPSSGSLVWSSTDVLGGSSGSVSAQGFVVSSPGSASLLSLDNGTLLSSVQIPLSFFPSNLLLAVLADDAVVLSADSGVHLVDFVTGSIRWSSSPCGQAMDFFFLFSQGVGPVVDAAGMIYVPCPGSIVAVDSQTGQTQWNASTSDPSCSPSLALTASSNLVVSCGTSVAVFSSGPPPSTPTPTPAAVSPTPTPAAVSPTPTPAAVSPTPTPAAVSPTGQAEVASSPTAAAQPPGGLDSGGAAAVSIGSIAAVGVAGFLCYKRRPSKAAAARLSSRGTDNVELVPVSTTPGEEV
jgi:hypothetical protein